jgi:5'-3' exonuclease
VTDKPRVLLIDLSSLYWAAYHVHAEAGPREPGKWTIDGVKRCLGDGGDLVAICCDSGKSFRKELSPEYKANREKQPAAAYGELERIKDRLRADGYLLWQVDGFEADDVIATACKAALDHDHDVRIASSDKDLMQLVSVRCDVLRTHTWEVWDSRKIIEQIRVSPDQLTDYLSLTGDTSDNIPGCQGIGKVRAAELLTKYKTLDRIYEALDANKQVSTPANERNLREQRKQVMLSRDLVKLRYDVPIDFSQLYAERKVTPLTENEGNPPGDDVEPSDATTAQEPGESPPESSGTTAAEADRGSEPVSVALVPVEYERQLEPRNLSAAAWLGKHMHNSRLYQKFPTAEAVTAVIIRGREMGIGALTALDCFHVIEGKPSPYAYLIIARAKAHPDCEYFQCIEADEKHAVWETKNRRNPHVTRVTYTIQQAQTANLVKPGNGWTKNTEDMLVKTAGAKLARREYPDAALGLYAVEELGGE